MSKKTNISNISIDTGLGTRILLEREEVLSRRHFLKGRTIGISVSESDDLDELGFSVSHIKDLIIELARYLIASGAKLAYGGDMRQGGFTELIFDLLAYYKADNTLLPYERFYSYLSFPISTTLSQSKEAELKQNVSFRKISPPEDLQIENNNEFLKPDTTANLYIWARCLTRMREEMEEDCDARIFVGGRNQGFKGIYPGILEEFLMALQYGHPVYLVGAFSGITNDILKVIQGEQCESMTEEHHLKVAEYRDVFMLYNKKHPDNPISYKNAIMTIQGIGIDKLSELNGLTKDENLRLAVTPHISEIIYLILKGLTNCFTK